MNYTLDALWWKLATPSVRDLAALLTAPPLWQSGCELSVRELLGERGFHYLLDLDGNPAPLDNYLAEHAPLRQPTRYLRRTPARILVHPRAAYRIARL